MPERGGTPSIFDASLADPEAFWMQAAQAVT